MIEQILNEAKAITGSDRQTALRIGYTAQEIAGWKAHRRPVPVEATTKLAQLIGKPPFQLICEIEASQAKSEESRKYWASLRRNAAAAAVAAIVTGNVYGHFTHKNNEMVGRVGIEPTTSGLKVRCSTD
jgi:hypothetical protein